MLTWIAGATGALSMLGAVTLVLSYALKSLRTQCRQHLLALSVADFGQGLFFVLSAAFYNEERGNDCSIMTPFGIFFGSASFLWTACVAFYIMKITTAAGSAELQAARRQTVLFHLLCWGYPLLISVAVGVFATEASDTVEGWCFISASEHHGWYWRLASIYVPLWVSWVCTGVFNAITVAAFKHRAVTFEKMTTSQISLSKFQAKMFWIPVVFVILRMPGSIVRVIQLMGKPPPKWLSVMQSLGDPGQGIANAVLFVFLNSRVQRYMSSKLKLFVAAMHKVFHFQPNKSMNESLLPKQDIPHEEESSTLRRTRDSGSTSSPKSCYSSDGGGYQSDGHPALIRTGPLSIEQNSENSRLPPGKLSGSTPSSQTSASHGTTGADGGIASSSSYRSGFDYSVPAANWGCEQVASNDAAVANSRSFAQGQAPKIQYEHQVPTFPAEASTIHTVHPKRKAKSISGTPL